MKGLYIHIPFCERKCRYCSFNSYSGIFHLAKNYKNAVISHIKSLAKDEINTIYMGGGTPSSIDEEIIGEILDAAFSHFNVSKNAEITIEINPKTSFKKLLAYKNYGINRLSIGAQSFIDEELELLGRNHSVNHIENCVFDVKSAGFTNFSLDLIYALPGQTIANLSTSLDRLLKLEPNHVSCYALSIDPNTPLYNDVLDKKAFVLEDEAYFDMYEFIRKTLTKSGFSHYEISNFARPPFYAVHNTNYWRNKNYYAVGAGASSFIDNKRITYTCDVEKYIENPCSYHECEVLTTQDKMSEFVFLNLRLLEEGVLEEEFFKKFNKNIYHVFGDVINNHIKNNLLKIENKRILLTKNSYYISNYVMKDFIL